MVISGHPLRLTTGLFLTALLACCEKTSETVDATWWRLEGERVALAAEVELAKQQLARVETRTDQFQAVHSAWDAVEGRAAALEAQLAGLRADHERLAREIQATREHGLAQRRQSRIGDRLDSVRDNRGREFHDVRISRVTETGIEFQHSTGVARLTAEDLGAAERDAFGIDRERSMELVALERQQQESYQNWADRRLAEQAEEARDRLPDPYEIRNTPIVVVSNRISTLDQTRRLSPLHQPARRTSSLRCYNMINHIDSYSSQTPFTTRTSSTRWRTLGNSPGGSRFNYPGSSSPYTTPCIPR